MRCAIYARYSSDMQRATSIDDQVGVARRYAKQHGWTVLDGQVYSDAGISGSSLEGRPGMEALMAAAGLQPRPFDGLLVDDSSRVARDLADALRFMQRLRFYGIRVLYLSQQIDSDHEQCETMVAVHGIVDGLYLRELAKKIKRGLAGQLERGYATGSRTFGYRTIPVPDPTGKPDRAGRPTTLGCEIAIEPSEAATVGHIFERYASGVGVGRIVEELNQANTPGPRGEPWRYNSVRRILRNERYRGFQVWGQKTYERRPGTRQKVARPVKRADWHTRERFDLRIVTPALWSRVQARFTEISGSVRRQPGSNLRRGGDGGLRSRHLFSGVMRCGVCGGAMGVVAGGHGSPRYGCVQSWRNGLAACHNRLTVRARLADAELLSGLQQRLLHSDTVAYVTAAVTAQVAEELDDRPVRRERLERERTTVQSKLDNLIASLENEGPSPSVRQAIRLREADLERLQRDLEGVQAPLGNKLAVLPSWVQRQLEDVVGLLAEDPPRVKAHLRKIGVGFTVSPVTGEGRPFLRAVGTANLLEATFGREFDFPSTGRSHPQSVP